MKQQFYSLPLSMASLMNKKEHPTCTLLQSVAQHLHLIITTAFGEFLSDEDFGCSLWEHDFDNITSVHKIKEWILQSLVSSISRYEKRLSQLRVDLTINQEVLHTRNEYQAKKKFLVIISGTLQPTNERFNYQDSFYTGPLSYQLT
jgi:phage baseplate assembly protein W